MTQTQLDDIDKVNMCYVGTLGRINGYAKDDETKEKFADVLTEARRKQRQSLQPVLEEQDDK